MSEVKTTIEKHEGGFTICNPDASKIKFTCLDGEVIELPELSLRMIFTKLYCSYTRDICGLRGSAVSWLNYQFAVKKTYKFWQKAFKENGCFEALKIKEPKF